MGQYRQIDGKKYDAAILELAEELTKGANDGRISRADAEKLFAAVRDGDTYTDIEKATVAYVRKTFRWTDAADEWFRGAIRKWAAQK